MNPELLRNLWIEGKVHRIALTVFAIAVIGLIARATEEAALGEVMQVLAFVFLALMGSHAAALSVVGEVRNRTWDQQRLSALGPWSMVWGKLVGATIVSWLGGLIVIAVLAIDTGAREGWSPVPVQVAKYLMLGVFAQSASMLAALVTIERVESLGRLQSLRAQVAGIAAGLLVVVYWPYPNEGGAKTLSWWGRAIDAETFALASLAVFASWTLLGCYRLMRRELAVGNRPLVLMGFLAFLALYGAGFDALLDDWSDQGVHGADTRLLIMLATMILATYVLVIAERKDPVLYRALFAGIARGRASRAEVYKAQGWMLAWCAAALVAGLMSVHALLPEGLRDRLTSDLTPEGGGAGLAVFALAGLGFLTRDCALFVACNGRRPSPRADSALIVALGLGYVGSTWLLSLNDAGWLMPLFVPLPQVDYAYGVPLAWGQAALALWFARRRLA